MLLASLIAALTALVLGSVALANTSGLNDHASTVAEEKAADAAVLGSSNAVDGGETSAAAKSKAEQVRSETPAETKDSRAPRTKAKARQAGKTHDTSDDAEQRGDTAKADAFGQARTAEVKAAHDAGETPQPAWKNEAHPTGGPEAATTPDKAEGRGASESHRADGEHRPDNAGKPDKGD